MKAYVRGIGSWLHDGDANVPESASNVIDARSKRGSSRFARMMTDVVVQAASAASFDLQKVATVYASAWGEMDIMTALFEQMHVGDQGLSPLRFKHSVHNAASGMLSIATNNRSFSTAIAGGARTLEQAFVEALALLATSEQEVVVAIGDDKLPEPFVRAHSFRPYGVALALSNSALSNSALSNSALSNSALSNQAADGAPLIELREGGLQNSTPIKGTLSDEYAYVSRLLLALTGGDETVCELGPRSDYGFVLRVVPPTRKAQQ